LLGSILLGGQHLEGVLLFLPMDLGPARQSFLSGGPCFANFPLPEIGCLPVLLKLPGNQALGGDGEGCLTPGLRHIIFQIAEEAGDPSFRIIGLDALVLDDPSNESGESG
jgi:hypothetical protein